MGQPRLKVGGRLEVSDEVRDYYNERSNVHGGQTRLMEEALEYYVGMILYGSPEIHVDVLEIKHMLHSLNESVSDLIAKRQTNNPIFELCETTIGDAK